MRLSIALPTALSARAALALTSIGIVIVMLAIPAGLVPLIAGWLGLAIWDRRWLTLSLVAAVPLTTFGWTLEIAELSGRTLDLRLVVTFAVAAIAAGSLLLSRGRPSRVEGLFLLFIGWAVASGIVAADSVLTWGPPIARLTAYAAVFALARRHLAGVDDLRVVSAVFAVAFAIPTLAGLVSYALGGADFINEAARAATPGGRGPISLAFAGQVALALGFMLFSIESRRKRTRWWWLGVAVVGAGGLLASATRLVTVTSWLILSGFAALRTHWRTALAITVLFAASFLIRPELLGRFIGTVGEPQPSSTDGVEDPNDPEREVELDASFRFRIFVWSAILDEWTEQPLTGVGPGMTAKIVAERSPAERAAPHNDYIGIFAETGFPGIVLYVAIQGLVIWGLVTRLRGEQDPRQRDLTLMCVLLFAGTNVLGALNNPIYFFDMQVGLWAMVGVALAREPADSPSFGEEAIADGPDRPDR